MAEIPMLKERLEEAFRTSRFQGKELPAREIFRIVAEHEVYHAGQIMNVRNLLAGRNGQNDPVIK